MKIQIIQNVPTQIKMQADYVRLNNGGRFGLVFWCDAPNITISTERNEPDRFNWNDFIAILSDDESNVLVKVVWTVENDEDRKVMNFQNKLFTEHEDSKECFAWYMMGVERFPDTFTYERINM